MQQVGPRLFVKKALDKAAALALLTVTAPVLGAAALAVRTTMGTPVFFRQQRPGRNGEPFRIVKMRTMTDDRDENGRLPPDEKRLTRARNAVQKAASLLH